MLRSTVPVGEERRGLSLSDANVEVREADGEQRFYGYAAVFDTRTAIGNPLTWGFYEEVAQGAFSKTLGEGDARMLIDHDSYYVVSRVSARTLFLVQDQRGLLTDSKLDPDLSYVRDLKANIRNENVTGMSFGFMVTKDDWTTEEVSTSDGNTAEVEVRTIREVKLIEVSAVTFPAYEETTTGLRHSLVPALLRRGDSDAIARAARHRPELAPLLGYDPDLAPANIALGQLGLLGSAGRDAALPGEVLGKDQPIRAEGNTMTPAEESDSEPAETTRTSSEQNTEDEITEPAASTRGFDFEQQQAKATAEALRHRLSLIKVA